MPIHIVPIIDNSVELAFLIGTAVTSSLKPTFLEISLKQGGCVDALSSICMKIYPISQDAVSKHQNHNQRLHIDSPVVKFGLLNEIADTKHNPYTCDIAACPVEELHRLRPYHLVSVLIDDLAVFAGVAVRDSRHVDI